MNNNIETARLILRRINQEDINDFYQIMGNDDTMKYLGKTLSNEEIGYYFDSLKNKEYDSIDGEYAIVLKDENKVIGQFSITTKIRDKRSEISYMLNSEYWNNGYISECVDIIKHILFDKFQMNKIVADCDVENKASIRILEKMNMKQEGVLRQERYSNQLGKYYDVAVFGILYNDYLKEKNDF